MKRRSLLFCKSLFAFCLICAPTAASFAQDGSGKHADDVIAKYRDSATERWQKEISQLQKLDQTQADPENGVLFIGSSSIRLWDTIAADMAPYQPIQRGYGGAKFTDLIVFADQLIKPHQFQAMVMFVANDVTGGDNDTSLDELEKIVRHIVDVARTHQPSAQLFIVEVTPTSSRYRSWDKIRQVNATLREIALTENNTHFIPTAEYYLDDEGKPRDEFFRDDKLHLNRKGYERWGNIIRHRLDTLLE